MLLTAGLGERGDSLADCDGLEGREGMGGGPQRPHNEGGHSPEGGWGYSHYRPKFCLASLHPPPVSTAPITL